MNSKIFLRDNKEEKVKSLIKRRRNEIYYKQFQLYQNY